MPSACQGNQPHRYYPLASHNTIALSLDWVIERQDYCILTKPSFNMEACFMIAAVARSFFKIYCIYLRLTFGCLQDVQLLQPSTSASGRVLMGLAHTSRLHWGVQFHPESVATKYGAAMLRNFREASQQHSRDRCLSLPSGVALILIVCRILLISHHLSVTHFPMLNTHLLLQSQEITSSGRLWSC